MTDFSIGNLIHAAPFFGFNRKQVQHAIDLKNAALKLLAVTLPADRGKVAEEVVRRTALMGELPAYGSVYDDVVNGRWPR